MALAIFIHLSELMQVLDTDAVLRVPVGQTVC